MLYKYRLHEFFVARFGPHRADAKRQLSSRYGINPKTIEHDCSKITEAAPIKLDRLKKYAEFFSCDVEELKTKAA